MELLTPQTYQEFDTFVENHPQGGFTQSTAWRKVKSNWGYEGVISRDTQGNIQGTVGVLVQKIPFIGTSFLYAPRGPVCNLHDRQVLADLKTGIDLLAKKHRAHLFKMDPDTLFSDTEFCRIAQEMGFVQHYGPDGFEGIQARFNYRLYLRGRTEEELFAALSQKTRYNIRVARKHGVQIEVVGPERLDDFMRIMRATGERDGFNIRPKAYFERMLAALGDHVRLYMAFYEGQAISGAITTCFGKKTCYVYGASDNIYRNVMPNYLIQWEMIRWAIATGCDLYDFQGVSGILDENHHMYGLYRFKKGFNGQLDELAGEFDYTYRPLSAHMVDTALSLHSKLNQWKRKLGRDA